MMEKYQSLSDIKVVPGTLELFRYMRVDWAGWPVRSQAERESFICRSHASFALLVNGIPVAMATVEYLDDIAWIAFVPSIYAKQYSKSLVKHWDYVLSCIRDRKPEEVLKLQSAVYPSNDFHRRFIQFFGFEYIGCADIGEVDLCEMDLYERGF